MKKIIIAPDSFKESLSADEVAKTIAKALNGKAKENGIEICCYTLPLADGGEGTLVSAVNSLGASLKESEVCGPYLKTHPKVNANYAFNETSNVAVIEMAKAAGIEILSREYEQFRNPLYTTTFGVGELISKAIEDGAKEILIGIGSSITCDGGLGMLQALGAKVYDNNDELISEIMTPALIKKVKKIKLSDARKALENAKISVLCDVKNPLLGINGANEYNLQKISSKYSDSEIKEIKTQLMEYLETLSSIIDEHNDNTPDNNYPGMGAAGGLGFGLACLGGELLPGAKTILKHSEFYNLISDADIVITGEGLINESSLNGKLPFTVLNESLENSKKASVIFVSGGNDLSQEKLNSISVSKSLSIVPSITDDVSYAMENAMECLTKLVESNFSTIINS